MSEHLQKIQAAVQWHSTKGITAPVEVLLQARSKLAASLFGFAEEIGDAYMDKVKSEYHRKRKYNEKRAQYVDNMKLPVSQAEIKAENDISEERQAEATADGIYRAMWLLYNSANEVLSAMSQQISTQNKEKSLEMRGMGSQAPHA